MIEICEETLIDQQFKVFDLMKHTNYNSMYSVIYKEDGKLYILKIENPEIKVSRRLLSNEIKAIKALKGHKCIPTLMKVGKFEGRVYMVISYLGRTLLEQVRLSPYFWMPRSVTEIAKELLSLIEYAHNKGYLIRNINPNSIMASPKNEVHLIELALAKMYIVNYKHIDLTFDKEFYGTTGYAALNVHKGIEAGRRDDLENFFYFLIFMYKKNLPWLEIKKLNIQEQRNEVREMKENVDVCELCTGIPGSVYLLKFFEHVKRLKFKEKPDYKMLNELLDSILTTIEEKENGNKKETRPVVRETGFKKWIEDIKNVFIFSSNKEKRKKQ